MRNWLILGAVASALLAGGCGQHQGAIAPRDSVSVKGFSSALPMREAFARAQAHAKSQYGDDFRPVMAFAEQAFDTSGKPHATSWRFNMVGHLRGDSDFSLVKIQVGPEGKAFVDPKRDGPFPDRNGNHLLPQLDLLGNVQPEAGMTIVKESRVGKNYPPSYAIGWEVRPNSRLKQTAMTYRWASVQGATKWWCDVALNPTTGEILEQYANH